MEQLLAQVSTSTILYWICIQYIILLQITGSDSGGETDYVSVVYQSISFTSADRNHDVTVQITSDNFTEFNENFTAVLTSVFLSRTTGGVAIELTDQERPRLVRDPDTATVNILDDDGISLCISSQT